MWKKHSAKQRDSKNLSADYAPWTSKKHVKLHGVSLNEYERVADLLNLAWHDRLSLERAALASNGAMPNEEELRKDSTGFRRIHRPLTEERC